MATVRPCAGHDLLQYLHQQPHLEEIICCKVDNEHDHLEVTISYHRNEDRPRLVHVSTNYLSILALLTSTVPIVKCKDWWKLFPSKSHFCQHWSQSANTNDMVQ